jgi:hypothetical protein
VESARHCRRVCIPHLHPASALPSASALRLDRCQQAHAWQHLSCEAASSLDKHVMLIVSRTRRHFCVSPSACHSASTIFPAGQLADGGYCLLFVWVCCAVSHRWPPTVGAACKNISYSVFDTGSTSHNLITCSTHCRTLFSGACSTCSTHYSTHSNCSTYGTSDVS